MGPLWMKRLQNRIGLGEIHLPDERKLPVPRSRVERPFVERRPAAAMAAPARSPRPPHDPTHPGVEGTSRPRAGGRPAPQPAAQPGRPVPAPPGCPPAVASRPNRRPPACRRPRTRPQPTGGPRHPRRHTTAKSNRG
ncbi:putative membrane mmpL3 domain protein [Mycobacterium xenopi 3993]|nr:putative membrane mmpL3 domain protein [Mycobacterium xenopi 3993]